MPRHLFIVSRRDPALYACLRNLFEGNDRVEVILDRRHGERRQRSGPASFAERRGADGHIREDVQRDLETHLYVIVTLR